MPQSTCVIPLIQSSSSGKSSATSSRHPSSEQHPLRDNSSASLLKHLTDDSNIHTDELNQDECKAESIDCEAVIINFHPSNLTSDIPLFTTLDESYKENGYIDKINKMNNMENCDKTYLALENQDSNMTNSNNNSSGKNSIPITEPLHSANQSVDPGILLNVSDSLRERTRSDATELRQTLLDARRVSFNGSIKHTISTLSMGVVRSAGEAYSDENVITHSNEENKRFDIISADDCTGLTTSVLNLEAASSDKLVSPSTSKTKRLSNAEGNADDLKKREALNDEEDEVEKSPRHGNRCKKFCQCLPCCRGPEAQTESLQSWLILVAVMWFNSISALSIISFSVIYIEICDQFNATKAAVGWLPGIKHFVACIVGIFVSHPINQYGCRLSAALGSIIVSVGIAASSLAPNLVSMYLLYGILAGIGQSMTNLTQSVIIQQRFTTNRGFATGISTLGFTVGNFVGAPLTSWLLSSYGLRGCLAMLAAIMAHRIPLGLLFCTPKRLILSKKQKSSDHTSSHTEVTDATAAVTAHNTTDDIAVAEVKPKSTMQKLRGYVRNSLDFSLFRDVSFSLFCVAGFLHKFYLHAFMNHMVSYCKHKGLTTENAVWSLSIIGISAFVFRFLVTLISNMRHVSRLLLFAGGLFFGFLAFLFILVIPGTTGPALSAATFGLHTGMTNTILTVVLVDLLGVSNITRCLALYNLTIAFGFLTGSSFVGWLYDIQDSYTTGYAVLSAMGLMACCLVVAAAVIDRHKQRSLKQQQQQQLLDNTVAANS